MSGLIIAIVIVVLLVVAALVVLPRMRKQAAERKAEQDRREQERRLEAERQEKAQEHRGVADDQRHRAELAEAEAQKARAEADINAKRADLHESGLADEQLPSGPSATTGGPGAAGTGAVAPNGRTEHSPERAPERDRDFRPGDDRDPDFERTGGGAATTADPDATRTADPGVRDPDVRDPGVRDLGGGGRAHEPAPAEQPAASEYERGQQDAERARRDEGGEPPPR